MGKKAIKHYFNAVTLTITALCLIFTFVGLYGGSVSPAGNTLRALSTLALPFVLVCNVLVLIYWALRRSWLALIPILALASCYRYISTMVQFRGEPEKAEYNLSIASYNVRGFNRDATGIVAMDIITTLQREGADVVCLQEFDNSASGDQRAVADRYKEYYPYRCVHHDMAIFSRYPIVKSQHLPFEESNNGAQWADIQLSKKQTVRVFNVHMETTGINGNGGRDNLIDSYSFNTVIRAGQAITIANEKRNSPHPIILCGDFNDVPYSFTYNTLLGELKDGFCEGGHGYGATYRGAKGIFRIDYIMIADNMECTDYYTTDQEFSDHNPVCAKIKL